MNKLQRNRRYYYTTGRRVLPQKDSIRLWRVHFVQYLLCLAAIIIFLRLFQIQIFQSAKLKDLADEQYLHEYSVKAPRGLIYDRNHKALALNKPCYDLELNTKAVSDATDTARKLSQILNQSEALLVNKIRKDSRYVVLSRRLEADEVAAIKKMNIPGLKIIETSERVYPLNEKLAQVIGFVGVDGDGLSGIELTYDKYLRGGNGWRILQKDANGKNLMPIDSATQEPKPGDDVILTIDHILQTIAEEELTSAVAKYQAQGGSVIITNPNTGEILAMASVPRFDANHATRYRPETWRIRPITDIFEPGSTFKIVTMMAALASGVKKTNDIFFCENGKFKFFGKEINDPKKYAWLSFKNVFKYSSNIGTVKIAQAVGKDRLFKAARDLGVGVKTGIGLRGEVAGILRQPMSWSEFSLAAISIGHEVAVTPLQMAMAYGAIANGGLLMKPAIVKEIKSKENKTLFQFKPQMIRRVMPQGIANTMASILEEAVSNGTGEQAKISGLRIAGKTGTAQKPLEDMHGYSNSKFVASFAGFFPAEQAQLLIFLTIDQPYPIHSGGQVAAPTFRKMLERIYKIYDEPPVRHVEIPSNRIEIAGTAEIPDFVGRRKETAIKLLNDLQIKYELLGTGEIVQAQELRTDPAHKEKPVLSLKLSNFPNKTEYTIMPKLAGFSLRQAIGILALRGLTVQIYGSGRIVGQAPEPGAKIKVGARCVLECEPVTNISLMGKSNNQENLLTRKTDYQEISR
ncbi:MAG: penicillin-binding transpeptidase domain-containing protein [bacterium]